MKAIFFILLVLSLFAFSYEKNKKECEEEFLSCNFKCGLTNKKDDTVAIVLCTNACQRDRTECLKNATD